MVKEVNSNSRLGGSNCNVCELYWKHNLKSDVRVKSISTVRILNVSWQMVPIE